MPAKFGTSGLRGLVEDLDNGTAAVHTAAFMRHLKNTGQISAGHKVYFGQDLRPSSAELAAKCMAATEDEGLVPIDCGALPTPALALFALARNAASIMITGSHIPADRNGVKFYRPDGEIDKHDEAAISELVGAFDLASMRPAPRTQPLISRDQAVSAFIARYQGILPEGALKNKRIGVYEHSTVIRDIFADILNPLGAEIISLGRSDIFVPVDTEAVSDATRARIRAWTESHRLDAVVSADGDADRPLLADETGECIRGDVLGLVTALHLEADSLVTPVTSNSGVEACFPGRVCRTKVGSPYVIAGMTELATNTAARIIGFEANGGVLTGSTFVSGTAEMTALPTRDCLLPILAALAASSKAGKPLSAVFAQHALPVAASGRIENFATEKSNALVDQLSHDENARRDFLEPIGKPVKVDLTDGLRMTLTDGRILHLRPSGNAPEMRIYAEAVDGTAAAELIEMTESRIRNWTE